MNELRNDEVDATETVSLISGDKVTGTKVYGSDSDAIGSVERVMIDKRSGKVSFVVLSVGGFLGIGDRRHPLPWDRLTYDEALDGDRVNVNRDQLEKAPSYEADAEPDWVDYDREVRGHYAALPPYAAMI
jgi:sporulation protein YlmC with PRC-barrel domain